MNNIYKISKYLLIISICIVTLYFGYLKKVSTIFGEENKTISSSNVTVDKEVTHEFKENIIDILIVDQYSFYISNNVSYLVGDNINLQVSDRVKKSYFVNNVLYFISNHNLYKYDFNALTSVDIEGYLNDFTVNNEIIYLCGEYYDDAVIFEYSIDLNYLNDYALGGDGFESFYNIRFYNNKLYLIGEKDSTSFYSPFKNCGLPNTVKTFMITYTPNDGIIEEVYFNLSENTETLKDVIYDKYIYLLLSSNEIICLDYNLNTIPIKKNTLNVDKLILSIKKDLLLFTNTDNTLYLYNNIFYQASSKIFKIGLKSGYLTIYLQDSKKIIEQTLFEYHVDKNEDLICSKYNYDLNTLNNLEVHSYFEELSKEILSTEPYLQKQLDGTYNVKYLITRQNNQKFELEGKLIIKHYVNVVDKGIYKVNKELSFFGKALLNNKEIYNGYIINKPGDYELVLEDINNVKRTYHFKVVNNYYLDDLTVTFDADYNLNQNETLDVIIDINNVDLQEIKEIIVNNQKYTSYDIIDNILYLHFIGKSYYSIDLYNIEKIILNNDQEIIINKILTIKTLNKLPSIILYQTSKLGTINLDYQIVDDSKTILYLKTELLENNQIQNTYYNYFNNEKSDYTQVSKDTTVKHYLGINNGNGVEEILICEYKIKTKDLNKIEKIDYQTDITINNINVDLKTTNATFEYLNVKEQNLLSTIEIISSLINYKTILYISLPLFLITFIYILIRKKIKNKKIN